jgi:hypothetical protein
VDGPVTHFPPILDHFEAKASLVDAKIEPASEHDHTRFGGILGGWIKLHGFLPKAVRRSTAPAADEESWKATHKLNNEPHGDPEEQLRRLCWTCNEIRRPSECTAPINRAVQYFVSELPSQQRARLQQQPCCPL